MRLNLMDVEAAAREVLPPAAWDYYAGGANDEVTLRENRRAFDDLAVRHRVLVDVSARTCHTTVLGTPVAFPVLIAPTAMQRLAHPDGEVATARAAAAAGTIMIVSTTATTRCEDVRAAAPGPLWFQLYLWKDREASRDLVQRAEACGYGALVLTVDTPVLGRRERDVRNAFSLPPHLRIENAAPLGAGAVPHEPGASGLAIHLQGLHESRLTLADLDWLASITRLPLLVKGVVRGDDARRALDHGVRGIIVSNHGGRQLDGSIATIRALPEVAEAVDGRVDVLMDGGVRRGVDVLRAIALGARAVCVGRPVLWGLAVGGEQGVAEVLAMLRDEFDLAMALAGCANVAGITRDLLA